MIGTLDPSCKDVAIVGAGFAGMVAAYWLDQAGWRVRLIEREARGGGLLSTRQTPYGLAETAAHSVLVTPAFAGLCADLGIELLPVRKQAKARYVLRNGQMRRVPLSACELLGMAKRAMLVSAEDDEGKLTMEEWGRRHLGQAAVDHLLAPFIAGIHGALPSEICVGAAFPSLVLDSGRSLVGQKFFSRSRAHAESPRRRPEMRAPRNGMGSLVQALEQRLQERLGDRFEKGRALECLPSQGNIILAVPASEAARLIRQADPELSKELNKVVYTPLVSVTAFLEIGSLKRRPTGVGVLVSAEEHDFPLLGVLFNSSSFAGRVSREREVCSVTVMLGGSRDARCIEADDDQISCRVRQGLEVLLGLSAPPLHLEISRWRRAIPRYSRELLDLWKVAAAGWCSKPGQILFGNYAGQVSLRGMAESAKSSFFNS